MRPSSVPSCFLRRTVLAVCFALLIVLQWRASAATNVQLTNAGLDGPYLPVQSGGQISGVIATGWSDNSNWGVTPTPTILYSQETANCHSGASCQKIDVTSVASGRMQFVQGYSQTAGSIYTVSAWVRGTPGVQVALSVQQASSPYATIVSGSITLADAWQQVLAMGYVTATESVYLMLAMSSPGTVWVDDFAASFTPGTSAPAPLLGPIPRSFFGMHVANYQQGSARNTGFEPPFALVGVNNSVSGQIAADWSDNSTWATPLPVITYSADTANPHSGSSCQKIVVSNVGADALQFVEPVSVIPGQKYTFSAWLRSADGMPVRMMVRQGPAPYTAYNDGGYPSPLTLTSDWRQYSVNATVQDSGDILLMFQSNSTGTVYIDDVTFTDASGKPVSGGVPWPQAPFGMLRLWDSGTAWTALEPVKGVWNWEPLDMWVAAAESHGVNEILLTMGQSPAWASSQPDNVNYIGAGAAAPPTNIQDWRDYITAVGKRYKGRIRNYEVWNEPNDPTYYAGTVPQLVDLTREAYKILKSIDPGNTVVAPVPYAAGYLDQLLQAGMAPYVDVISFHFYTYTAPPEQVGPGIANVRLVMAKNGVSAMPFWDTEGASGDTTTTEDQGAAYLVRRYLVDLAYGSARYDWYTWSKGSTFCAATEQSDPRQLTKAGVAFRVLQNWLSGASLTGVTIDSAGTWQVGLKLQDGSAGMIAWNPLTTVQITLPSGIHASTARDIFGGSTAVSGPTVLVNAFPQLFSAYNRPLPSILSVVNAADRTGNISPGALGVVTGSNLAPAAGSAELTPLPAVMGGTSVFVNGVIAPLMYVDPNQVVFQVPSSTAPQNASVLVGSTSGLSSAATVPVSAAAPAIFQLAGHAVGVNADGRVNSPAHPAAAGSNLWVYFTGVGPVTPAPNDGSAASGTPAFAAFPATATIGGIHATVQPVALTPGFVGVAGTVVQVPASTAGDQPLVITVNGAASAPAVVSIVPAVVVPH